MKNKILVALLAIALPLITQAAVSGLTFTTDPRTVAPSTISERLTISSGEAPGEIADLALTSSSASGEFVNESGEAIRPTWNSNWANRTFYYRDSSSGTHTITATLTTRAGQESWSASQTITVGVGAGPVDDPDDSNNDDGNDDQSDNESDSSGGSSSAHSSQTPVGQVNSTLPFKVGAGRSRLVSVHSPVTFQAETSGAIPEKVRYRWSFGDGGSAVGSQATHTYSFPGEYNVVVTAVGRDQITAVGRTMISVVDPSVTFGQIATDRVELINKSARELNLGGWQIRQGLTTFVFPTDTIVTANKSLSVSAELLGFSPLPSEPLTLTFPDQTVALTSQSLETLKQTVAELSSQLATVKKVKPAKAPTLVSPPSTPPPVVAAVALVPSPPRRVEATIPVLKAPSLFTRIKNWFTQ